MLPLRVCIVLKFATSFVRLSNLLSLLYIDCIDIFLHMHLSCHVHMIITVE